MPMSVEVAAIGAGIRREADRFSASRRRALSGAAAFQLLHADPATLRLAR